MSVAIKETLERQEKTVQHLVNDVTKKNCGDDSEVEGQIDADGHSSLAGWIRKYDQNIGRVYYLNLETSRRQWQRPPAFKKVAAKVILAHHFTSSLKSMCSLRKADTERTSEGPDLQKESREVEGPSATVGAEGAAGGMHLNFLSPSLLEQAGEHVAAQRRRLKPLPGTVVPFP